MIFGNYKECIYNLKLPKGERSRSELDLNGGIYGIYINDNLYYIGKTNCFIDRYSLHKSHLLNGTGLKKLYTTLREAKISNSTIYFIPIMTIEDIKNTNFTIEEMKNILISNLKPNGNTEGIDTKYRQYKSI